MKSDFISHISAGLATVILGYSAAVVIIIQAATLAGASPAQISSWLFVLGIGMGVTSIGFSLVYKIPILTAWSTPGAALLITNVAGFTLPEIIGAFVGSACLLLLTGLIPKISGWIERIPSVLTTAMLAGILLQFGIGAFKPVSSNLVLVLSMFASYVLARRFFPRYTMLCLLSVGLGVVVLQGTFSPQSLQLELSKPVWTTPVFSWSAFVSISIPLYLVTMVSQNLPGIAMFQTYQFKPPVARILQGVGVVNVLLAPFGGFTYNLAAISAALCLSEEAGHNREQRYWAAVYAGVFYFIAGLFGASIASLFLAMPKELALVLAGFALLGTIMLNLANALADAAKREAALITFLITASGVSLLGIGSTVWGLIGGGLAYAVLGYKR